MALYTDIASLRAAAFDFFTTEGVLTFGDFTLKSGRKSPYFFNTGSLCSGRQLAGMGKLYASLLNLTPEFSSTTVIFGSAYKGIPIACSTALALAGSPMEELRAVSDRKEAKTHGDASGFLGVIKQGDKAVVVDDVITTGGTKLEALEKIQAAGCTPIGLIIAFDRAEPVDDDGTTALEAFSKQTGLPVYPLLSVHDIIAAKPELRTTLKAHLESFGTVAS